MKHRVIIEVEGGVAYVTAASPDVEVLVMDWDAVKAGELNMPFFEQSPSDVDYKLAQINAELERKRQGQPEAA